MIHSDVTYMMARNGDIYLTGLSILLIISFNEMLYCMTQIQEIAIGRNAQKLTPMGDCFYVSRALMFGFFWEVIRSDG